MAHPAYLREKARELRRRNDMTIDELSECLALPRTTIYYWVRDLPIATTALQKASARAAGRVTREKHRRLREAAYDDGRRTFEELGADPSFRDFVVLFITEGFKRTRHKVSIANSDPAVVQLADHWIRKLSPRPARYSVQFHRDQDPGYLQRFWAFGLGVEPTDIRLQRKSNSNGLTGRTWRSRWGVLTVEVNDTNLRMRMEGWITELRRLWGLDSTLGGA